MLPALAENHRLIDEFALASPVITPNGDGIHDSVEWIVDALRNSPRALALQGGS